MSKINGKGQRNTPSKPQPGLPWSPPGLKWTVAAQDLLGPTGEPSRDSYWMGPWDSKLFGFNLNTNWQECSPETGKTNMLLLEVATKFILYVVAIEVSANHHDCWNKRTWSMDINAFHANLGHIVNIGYPTFDPMKCHRFTFIKSLTRFQHHNPFDKKVSIFFHSKGSAWIGLTLVLSL